MKLSDFFILGSALMSLVLSLYLWFYADKELAIFVGIWVPSLLGFGNYIKSLYGGHNNGK